MSTPRLERSIRAITLFTIGCLLAALFALPSPPAYAQSSAIARIQATGKLTVAVFFEDVVPFFYVGPEGKLVGVDPAIAEDIAEKLGVTLEYNRAATTFDGLIDEVVEGRADMAISLLSDTLERAARASFSQSYVSVRQFLLINRLQLGRLVAADPERANDIPALLNNPQSRIGVIDGTSYVGFVAEDFPEAQNVAFNTWAEMLAAVKSGDLVALMYDEIEIGNWRLADSAGAVELRPYHLAGHPDTIAIAMPPGNTDLKAWVDLYLTKAKGNGFLDGVLNTYLYSKDRALIDG
ncbi:MULTISPECIES: ABC transporter substrate-binding protein [unclassified Devosia]|uniref:ABC transporter substrate-binding protein n=1 Tax=unclassified Devosia TaxID=196773 RepID=UPI00138F2961|nr:MULTISPECIES: ABC transporter substrate-binding protein [unclassified Devosia]